MEQTGFFFSCPIQFLNCKSFAERKTICKKKDKQNKQKSGESP
jgi:hypothetical protein